MKPTMSISFSHDGKQIGISLDGDEAGLRASVYINNVWCGDGCVVELDGSWTFVDCPADLGDEMYDAIDLAINDYLRSR